MRVLAADSLTHFVRSTFTSVTSPLALKNSLSRASSTYFGMFFTHSRDEGGTSSVGAPSGNILDECCFYRIRTIIGYDI